MEIILVIIVNSSDWISSDIYLVNIGIRSNVDVSGGIWCKMLNLEKHKNYEQNICFCKHISYFTIFSIFNPLCIKTEVLCNFWIWPNSSNSFCQNVIKLHIF